MSRRADAMLRDCPACGVFPGQPCQGITGPRRSVHRARFKGNLHVPQKPKGPLATEQELISRMITEEMDALYERLGYSVLTGTRECESPIERVFMAALIMESSRNGPEHTAFVYGARYQEGTPPFEGLHVWPQASIDGYRLDFLMVLMSDDGSLSFTAVECDGHDFHERTKEQASRDKRRDRHFTAKGWKVIRFTGSDIWADPAACAVEAILIARGEEIE